MLIRRRTLMAAAAASTIAAPAVHAQTKQINLAGASYDMREAILGEFGKRTGITPRPFVNPSTQVRVDRLRTAPVDCVLLDAPFAAYANSEKLLQPIDISRLPNWSKLNALLKDGRATPTASLSARRPTSSSRHQRCGSTRRSTRKTSARSSATAWSKCFRVTPRRSRSTRRSLTSPIRRS